MANADADDDPVQAALARIDGWPVDHAAAAVVSAGGDVTARGDTDRIFELASVTKLLVATGALLAVEEGAVELATPAGPHGSTVRHLLAHASGLGFDTEAGAGPQAPPGAKRIYSSAGYEVLADLIAGETGMPFAGYLHEGVFAPLGMTKTRLWGPAGHGARSSVTDLVRFAGALLGAPAYPQVLAPQTLAEATTVQFPGLDGILPGYGRQKPNDWGLGFEIRGGKTPHWTGRRNSAGTFGHFGQAGTFLWVDPAAGLACTALTDRDFGPWAKPLWPELADAVLESAGSPESPESLESLESAAHDRR